MQGGCVLSQNLYSYGLALLLQRWRQPTTGGSSYYKQQQSGWFKTSTASATPPIQ